MDLDKKPTPLTELNTQLLDERGVKLYIKRDDLIDPEISGNKWRKLKYNLLEAEKSGYDTLLTFGGAYSNHIYAVAAAGKKYGFKTIGIIRGEEYLPLNPTLSFAQECGILLAYVSREEYKDKAEEYFLEQLAIKYGKFYLIPEGGTNELAVKGCEEIVPEINIDFDYICSACGTGGTISGIINSVNERQKVLGFPALKGGDFLRDEIRGFMNSSSNHWDLITDYHFGGYAKVKPELLEFMNWFQSEFQIELDPIYTGKLFFGLFNMIKKDYFKKRETIIALHTGGLQGVEGMKQRGLV